MSVVSVVDALLAPLRNDFADGARPLSEEGRLAVDALLPELRWLGPAERITPMAQRADRLRLAAAELAIAALTADGELAWALSECAVALGEVIYETGPGGSLQRRQPTPAELADAEHALRDICVFLERLSRHPG
jgi:hypothetical protein